MIAAHARMLSRPLILERIARNFSNSFKDYLCDFSLLLIYCHSRNWDCEHIGSSCILNLRLLSFISREVSTRLLWSIFNIEVIGGNFERIPLPLVCFW